MTPDEFEDFASKAAAAAQPEAPPETIREFCASWALLLGRYGATLRDAINKSAEAAGYDRIDVQGHSPRGPVTAPTSPPTLRQLWQFIGIARTKCLRLDLHRPCGCEPGEAGPRQRRDDYRKRRGGMRR